ncbi:MAG: lysozyme inhibitor LprI family protein [Sarcina sp.]
MRLVMENKSGVRKKVKEGFSWTTFFFGWIPSLMRGDIISALKIFILGSMTLGIYTAFKSRTVNKDYKEFLLEKGYEEIDIEEGGMPSCGILEGCFVGARIGITVILPIALLVLPLVAFNNDMLLEVNNFIINPPKVQSDNQSGEVSNNTSINNKEAQRNSNNVIEKKVEEVNNANTNIYKTTVTKKELETDYNKYNKVLGDLRITYGTAYKDYGLIFEGNETKEEQENNLNRVNEYFKNLDDSLNEQWVAIKGVLNEKAFKELQKEQIKWIEYRDKIAKEKSESTNKDFKTISFIMNQGKQTEIRIAQLNDKYLNPKNMK